MANPQTSPAPISWPKIPPARLIPLIVLIILVAGGVLWWLLTREPGITPQAQPGEPQLQGVIISVDKAAQTFVLEQARIEEKDGKFQRIGGTFIIAWSNKTKFFQNGNSVNESLIAPQQPALVTLFRPESKENRKGATAKEIRILPK